MRIKILACLALAVCIFAVPVSAKDKNKTADMFLNGWGTVAVPDNLYIQSGTQQLLIAREAEIHGIDLRLCGEMAGDPMCVAILIGLGYRHLSMNGRSVARVKYLLRRIDYAEAENLAQRSLEAQLATEVRHQVAAFMERRGMGGLIRGGL